MEQTQPPVPQKKRSLFSLIKTYWWQIILFFIIAITSGVLLANQEAKTAANWETFRSKDAGISFKHPQLAKVIEDNGWRITVYLSEQTPENNIKILYSHTSSNPEAVSVEEQFLANCQATRVSEITAIGARIKVYEDSTCGGQLVENSVIVYSENGMNYDIGLFGKIDRTQLYQFLATFRFENVAEVPTLAPSIPLSPIPSRSSDKAEGKMCGGIAAIQCPTGFICKLDGSYPDAGGTCVSTVPETTKPEEVTMCTMDAKECSDGSFVGRTGPNCEFVCPDGSRSR